MGGCHDGLAHKEAAEHHACIFFFLFPGDSETLGPMYGMHVRRVMSLSFLLHPIWAFCGSSRPTTVGIALM